MKQPMPPDPDSFAMLALDPRDTAAMELLGHDLRATLSEVIGGLRLIDPAPLPPGTRQQIARTKAAGEALALLLEQALILLLGDSYLGDTCQPPLQTERLLDGIRLRWESRARENGLSFQLLSGHGIPPLLSLDAALIERILSNLLGNAIKYAGSGKITCVLDMHKAHSLKLTVHDEGPGFAQSALPRLFTPYAGRENAHKPGSGLGLHIVHDMVERAGGTIEARNRPNGGAEVTVVIPMAQSDASQLLAVPTEIMPDLSHCRVLVADDNLTSRQLLSHMLSAMGAEVVTVADGVQAIGRIERESFNLLVIDIEMPGFNGVDAIRHIRAMPGSVARLPILAVTAYRMRANKTAIENAGADGILSKPILTAHALAEAVAAVLNLHTPDSPPAPQLEPALFDRLLRMAGPAAAAELIERLLDDLLAAERSLLSASHGPDWLAIRAQTHVLMALAGTAGAPRLHHLAEEMNALAHQPSPDRGTFLTLLPQLLESLDALIHFVGEQSPEQGGRR